MRSLTHAVIQIKTRIAQPKTHELIAAPWENSKYQFSVTHSHIFTETLGNLLKPMTNRSRNLRMHQSHLDCWSSLLILWGFMVEVAQFSPFVAASCSKHKNRAKTVTEELRWQKLRDGGWGKKNGGDLGGEKKGTTDGEEERERQVGRSAYLPELLLYFKKICTQGKLRDLSC